MLSSFQGKLVRNGEDKKAVVSLQNVCDLSILPVSFGHNKVNMTMTCSYNVGSRFKGGNSLMTQLTSYCTRQHLSIFFIVSGDTLVNICLCHCLQVWIEGNIASGKTTCLEYFSKTSNIEVQYRASSVKRSIMQIYILHSAPTMKLPLLL